MCNAQLFQALSLNFLTSKAFLGHLHCPLGSPTSTSWWYFLVPVSISLSLSLPPSLSLFVLRKKKSKTKKRMKEEEIEKVCEVIRYPGIFLGTSQLAYRLEKLGRSPSPARGGGVRGHAPPGNFWKSDAIICIFVVFEGHKIAPWWLFFDERCWPCGLFLVQCWTTKRRDWVELNGIRAGKRRCMHWPLKRYFFR